MSNGTYVIKNVSPTQLTNATYEPEVRMESNMALNKLKRSIDEIGLQYPPLVAQKVTGDKIDEFIIIDGHRRIAAMKALNYATIPVIVTNGDKSPDELFADVSGTVKQLNASEWLEVFLKGGILPGGPTKTNIRRLDEIMGRDFLRLLHEAKIRPSIWSLAGRVIKYIPQLKDTIDNKRRVLTWIYKNRITQQVNAWISGQNPVNGLYQAILEDRAPTIM